MSISCPIKTDPSWVKLNNILRNETAAYQVYISHGGVLPRIDTPAELKKRIKFSYGNRTSATVARVQKLLSVYNRDYNTSHRLEVTETSGSSESMKLIVNYMPRIHNLIYDNRTTKIVDVPDSHTDVTVTKSINDIITQDGNQYFINGELYPSYEDARASLFDDEYQLSASGVEAENIELNEVLEGIMERVGVSVENIDNFKDVYGVDGVAVADMANKIIAVAKGKADITTLPEESAHFILAMLGTEHPLYKAAYKVIEQTDVYQQVKTEYGALYNNSEERLRIEAMGKLLGSYYIQRFENKSDLPIPVKSVFDRIINWLTRLFKGVDTVPLQTKLDEVFGQLANKTFSGDLILSDSNLSSDKYFELGSTKNELQRTVARLKHELESLRDRSDDKTYATKEALRIAIETLTEKLDKAQISVGIEQYLDYAIRNELNHLIRIKDDYLSGKNPEIPNSFIVNSMRSVVKLHGTILKDTRHALAIENDPSLNDFFNNKLMTNVANVTIGNVRSDKTTVKEQFDAATAMVSQLDDFIKFISIKTGSKALIDSGYLPDGVNPEDILRSSVGDSTSPASLFMPIYTSNDVISRVFYKTITNIYLENHRDVLTRGNNLKRLQLEMEAAGFTDMTMFHEKDSNGKATGYLLNPEKWGEYNQARDKMIKRIESIFGEPFYDIDIKTLKESKDPENIKLVNTYNNIFNEFRNEFEYYEPNGQVWIAKPKYNPEYKRVINLHPTVKAYYDALVELHNMSKERLPRVQNLDRNFWLVPQMTKHVSQVLKYSDNTLMSQMYSKAKELVKFDARDDEFGDVTGDVHIFNGSAIKTVPMYFTKKLSDMSALSNDFTSMYALYDEMSSNFKSLSEHREDIELVLSLMADRLVYKNEADKKLEESGQVVGLGKRGSETKDFARLVSFVDRNVFYHHKKQIIVKLPINIPGVGRELNLTKAGYGFLSMVRAINLFAQVFTITAGLIKSSIDNALEDVYGEFSTPESKRWAMAEYGKKTIKGVNETGRRMKSNKVKAALDYFGVSGDTRKLFDKLDIRSKFGRVGKDDVIYGGYEQVSNMTRGTFVLSMMDNYRLVGDKFIRKSEFKKLSETKRLGNWNDYRDKSLYNAYDVVNGGLVVKPEYSKYITKDFENYVHGVIRNRTAIIEGLLNKEDKGAIFGNFFGEALMLHRGWMVTSITDGFKSKRVNPITGLTEEGFRLTGIRMLGRTGKMIWKAITTNNASATERLAMINFKGGWNNLEGYEKRNILKLSLDASMFALLGVISLLLHKSDMGDDEDDSWWERALLYLSTRAVLEQGALYNPKELMNILNSPSAATNTLDTLDAFVRSFAANEEIEYGPYENMTPRQKAIIKLTIFKNMYELQNPEIKDKYITNQIL